jgi:hypothetical protein
MTALISTGRHSPEPSRECSSMFLTMKDRAHDECTGEVKKSRNSNVSGLSRTRYGEADIHHVAPIRFDL